MVKDETISACIVISLLTTICIICPVVFGIGMLTIGLVDTISWICIVCPIAFVILLILWMSVGE